MSVPLVPRPLAAALTLAIATLLSCSAALAGSESEVRTSFSVTVAVLDSANAARSSELVSAVQRRDTAGVWNSVSNAVSARLTFAETGTAEAPPGSVVRDMQRYVTLRFTTPSDPSAVLQQLHADPQLGYVGLETEAGFSADRVPNDRFLSTQWWLASSNIEHFPQIWDYTTGTRLLGLLDSHVDLNFPTGVEGQTGHPDLTYKFARNFARSSTGDMAEAYITSEFGITYHGTHVAGILSAKTNNDSAIGDRSTAATCWSCRIALAAAYTPAARVSSAVFLANSGATVVNLSGFIRGNTGNGVPTPPNGTPCANFAPSLQHPMCASLRYLKERDVLFVASAGNDLRGINFPASEPDALSVGGTMENGAVWNEGVGNCPTGYPDLNQECGSNLGPQQDFMAPARNVLSTVDNSTPFASCGNRPAGYPNAAYGNCTGTSMSAPIISGMIGLLRSANPLLNADDVVRAMRRSSQFPNVLDPNKGYGQVDGALAVKRVLGHVAGRQVENRLTPMFAMVNDDVVDRLYTTSPQTAIGAYGDGVASFGGAYLTAPGVNVNIPYRFQTGGTRPVTGYVVPGMQQFWAPQDPTSSFALFTTRRNPFDGSALANVALDEQLLIPLYKLSYRSPTTACERRDHYYTTDLAQAISWESIDLCPQSSGTGLYPKPWSFRVDQIEGFILSQCPAGYTCANAADPTEPQRLYQVLKTGSTNDRALILESQLAEPFYAAYATGQRTALGYVFPNIDTDGDTLIDGFERFLGTHPRVKDSDCDIVPDGFEYPLDRLQGDQNDPAQGVSGCADLGVTVSGQVISQTASTRVLTHTIGLRNEYGPSAGVAVSVAVNFPNEDGQLTGVTVPSGWSCSVVNVRRVQCSGPSPAVGQALALLLTTSRDQPGAAGAGSVQVSTVDTTTAPDPLPTNNSAQWTAPAAPSVDASLSYQANTGTEGQNYVTEYTLTVTVPAGGSYVPPANLTVAVQGYKKLTASGWTCAPSLLQINCSINALQPGSTHIFTFIVTRPIAAAPVPGNAVLSGFTDPNLLNNAINGIPF